MHFVYLSQHFHIVSIVTSTFKWHLSEAVVWRCSVKMTVLSTFVKFIGRELQWSLKITPKYVSCK